MVDGRQHLFGYVMRDVDELIATLRKRRFSESKTQQDVADKAGMNRSSVTDYEAGKTHPGGFNLFLWAHALGFDIALIPRRRDG